MKWKDLVNDRLSRTTGYELRRVRGQTGRPAVPAVEGERLVASPAFVMCTLRSGSTLLRVLLDSHSQIHAPIELLLGHLDVSVKSKWAVRAMEEIGLDAERLEYLLWDRVLHRQLTHSGKQLLVNKTPNDVFIADRIKACWPDARFIFLLRHPAAIVRSRQNLRPDSDNSVETILRYGEALERARQTHSGITVRYEDVTADPRRETQRICSFLGVPWESGMVDYGHHDHGRYKAGLGDWAGKIRTGEVQKAEPPPEQTPPELEALAAAWGYTPAPAPVEPVAATPPGSAGS